jgi:heme oxygenase (biliverdin-producing, ferredoxin)
MTAPAATRGAAAAYGQALSARLKQATAALHRRAEHAGVMPALLHGRLAIEDYLALLAQLEAVYAALEAGLDRPGAPALDPALRRLPALRLDLATLHAHAGDGDAAPAQAAGRNGSERNARRPSVLAPTERYVHHLHALAAGQPWRLAAHAYVRYLGDLAGGQVLQRVVGRAYGLGEGGLPDDGLRFYDFGPPAQAAALARGLRDTLDALPAAQADALVDEACLGFAAHADIFEALAAVVPWPQPSRNSRSNP